VAGPAITSELAPHFPLVVPRGAEGGSGFVVCDIEAIVEFCDEVGAPAIDDRIARLGIEEVEGLREGELDGVLAGGELNRPCGVGFKGEGFEVVVQGLDKAFGGLG